MSVDVTNETQWVIDPKVFHNIEELWNSNH